MPGELAALVCVEDLRRAEARQRLLQSEMQNELPMVLVNRLSNAHC